MRTLAVSVVLLAMLTGVTSADWDYSSQKFGASLGAADVRVYNPWSGWFPRSGLEAGQFWGRRFGLTGIRLLERLGISRPEIGYDLTGLGATVAAALPFARYSSISASVSSWTSAPDFDYWGVVPAVGIVWNQNDQDFLVGSRELWYEDFGLRADVSLPVGPDMPRGWGLEAMVSVPYTVRFDWGRIEAGPHLLARTGCPIPLYFESALEVEADAGRELTTISLFAEEHESPSLGWRAFLVPSYRTWRLSPWEGDTVEIWFSEVLLRAYGAIRIPVVGGLHVEPALTTSGNLSSGSALSEFWPSISFGFVQALAAEKYLVARLETKAWSLRVWESPQLSLAVSYGCREVTRVGDDETIHGPGGTMNPWKEQHQNPSP